MMLKTLTNLIIYDDGDFNDHIDDTCSDITMLKTLTILIDHYNNDEKDNNDDTDKDIMMLKTLTIFIASFRKQSGRRMRKYGLVLPDKQSAGTIIFFEISKKLNFEI